MSKFSTPFLMKSPLKDNGYGESRGEGHQSGQSFRYDPSDKAKFNALNQVQKDSLHGEAMKYGKPFFSPTHGVNVDPEDGVLSGRPIYSDNTKLTYEKIDEPHPGPSRKSPLHSHQGPCWDGYVRDHSKKEGEPKSCYKPGKKK